ncbi:winged helix-turn-helix transcriptional regulator [Mycobacteroides abscessus]|uniref:winged helix-turn-helix transcriptional regulator n=1 Tax=Mycobacteroides abscessus TaxID=36809 RepID=UPI0009A7C400|nr:helix-turn-helix domain-containing protein [Mycobacteroides abscessus]MDO3299923.1 helix-turn-helix domain-containing protein [Mycobacteroides abscessus subsp. massiliense]SKI01194.1 Putative transcriptional regulator [Mycobacteroides abscessus subsp. massiliense]SKL93914.1 Putative transcriptional regulator [Mycobacteroides abscessus subsp. massiliense]SLD26175.1 Putative transcriptional regulator [Mycobacteroides abscessus subsp. massiliense]SLD43995.1 Putative transcriptional regulator [
MSVSSQPMDDWWGNLFDTQCPTRIVLDRIGDKWTVLVVAALADGPMRFTALRDRIGGVTGKVLTSTLRSMLRDGLVKRTAYATVPPKVEYELTELGLSLREPIDQLRTWAERNVAHIVRNREAHDGDVPSTDRTMG